jgi:hypothetical protein
METMHLQSRLRNIQLLARNIYLSASVVTFSNVAAAAPASSPSNPTDYSLLSHDLEISMVRAGTHNGEKTNQYQFKVTAYGLINSPEEKGKEIARRKKVQSDLGIFGDTTLEPLAFWRQDEKSKSSKQFHVDGKVLRELVAKTMTELQIQESQVGVQTDVALIAKRKKYFVLNDDQVIATISFNPLIPTPVGTNIPDQAFTMTDDKGTLVKLQVRFAGSNSSGDKAKK